MKPGLVIWAHSVCRSVMGVYRAMGELMGVPLIVALWHPRPCDGGSRVKAGFRVDEFADMQFVDIGENYEKGLELLKRCRGWRHLFCVYQISPTFRRLLVEAHRAGDEVGVMCESPCNMASGFRRVMKNIYMRTLLPWKSRKVIAAARFFVNYSGDDWRAACASGWSKEKVIPFGYFPPPIEGSKCVARARCPRPFTILATGILARYRGADVLVKALKILKDHGVPYRATITQSGELLDGLKDYSRRYDLPIDFPGFVSMPDLVKLYESCSVYVGSGRSEPWGMRLNDALNCGAPLVVSRGMGGVKLVDDYGCGMAFDAGDAKGLASALETLARDSDRYNACAVAAVQAAQKCDPRTKARELLEKIGWLA